MSEPLPAGELFTFAWRRVAAITALLGLVGLVAAAAVYAVRYQPVRQGHTWASPLAEDGRAFGISVWNDGRFTIRLTSVDVPTGMSARLAPRGQIGGVGPTTAFRPFELKAGEERFLWMMTTLPFCKRPLPASRSELVTHNQTVHYSVLGLSKTATVRLYSPAPRRHDRPLRRGIDERGAPERAPLRGV